MSTVRVLVVDDDPWTQRMVSAVLGHRGFQVDLAKDGWEALTLAGRARPNLVITDVRLRSSDGWSFAELLRARAETHDTPVLFLAAFNTERSPGQGFRPELDAILAKPFRLEHLEARALALLAGKGKARAPIEDDRPSAAVRPELEERRRSALTGRLDQFGLSAILIVIELERKSGTLTVQSPATAARLTVRDGRVIRAELDGAGAPTGAPAVYEALGWGRGRFEFTAAEVSGTDEIGCSTSYLLLEGARREDERNALAREARSQEGDGPRS